MSNIDAALFHRAVQGEGRYIRQRGAPGRYGHVILVVEPSATEGLTFLWEAREADVPRAFEAAIEQGVRALFTSDGPFQGIREALRVRIVGGSHHETDSNEPSYVMAAAAAFRDAASRAGAGGAA